MKRTKLYNLIIFLLTLLLMNLSSAIASNNLKYYLYQSNITDACITSVGDFYVVTIELVPSAAKEFSKFTGNNVNQLLEVYFNNQILKKVTIRERIKSGKMRLGIGSKTDAEKMLKYILKDLVHSK